MRLVLRPLSVIVVLVLAAGALGGCAPGPATASGGMDGMPDGVRSAPVTVQQAYQFAVANPGTLQQIPCYCGCGAIGHTSNYSCYVTGTDAAGKITYDEHALGCSICVDITQDVMRMQKQGQKIGDIRAAIDAKYSKYGPSNRK